MARTSSKIVKKIPANEEGKVSCFTNIDKTGDEYLITQNTLKEQFTLWKVLDNDEGFEKISISDNPLKFDKIVFK